MSFQVLVCATSILLSLLLFVSYSQQKMEYLPSSCCNLQSLPLNFVFPPHIRPGYFTVAISNSSPIIDLAELDRATTVEHLIKASQEFGYFQVINHGIDEELVKSAIRVWKEFFDLPAQDRAEMCSADPTISCRLSGVTVSYAGEKVTLWREKLRHYCILCTSTFKDGLKSPKHTEVVGNYVEQVTRLGSRILELICEGLGLESGFFEGQMSQDTILSVNYYPKCPEPGLTCGIPPHCDSSLLTILVKEDLDGLQFVEDGKWVGVAPVPNSLLVNLGYALQIISNNMLKAAEHRAVANTEGARISGAFFINPSNDTIVEPAKALLNSGKRPLYRSFEFKELAANYLANNFDPRLVLEPFKL